MTNSRGQDSYPRAPYEGVPGGYPGEAGRSRGEPSPYPRTREFDPAPRAREQDVRDWAPRDGGRDPGVRSRDPDVRGRDPDVRGRGQDGRDPGGRVQEGRRSQSGGPLSWWGTLSGGLGVCIVIGAALLGALGTVITDRDPGSLLGLFVVVGTIAAGFAVHDRAAYLIIPVPALAYVAAAIMAGAIHDRAIDTSRTQLLVSAGQWIASGFLAISAATILAVLIAATRWIQSRRRHPAEL
jgi:hypothetical protein